MPPRGGSLASLCERSRPLGRSDVRVGALGIGTAALTVPYGAPGAQRPAPPAQSVATAIERALARGVSLIDTAPAYADSEAAVGAACEGADCVIATKLAIPPQGWEALDRAATAEHVRRSAERSRRLLRRERIDVLAVHNADRVLIEHGDVVAALETLRDEGIVRACGASVYGEDNALAAIECPLFDAVQVAHSALDRRPERTLAAAAQRSGTSLIGRSVLLRGVLSTAGRELGGAFAPLRAAADAFRAAFDCSWEELPGAAVAFALTRPGISATLLGPRDVEELEELLDGAERFLDAARALDGHWGEGLDARLLDPSRWAELA
ncbi:MAG TPA: aldo/keto reductase [Solirubrobacteraceae bacterium]|nr:aldo/keto reductase [Solirubrobacteraceae bacterium]